MSTGGTGFFTLTLGGQRIAYLQCIKHIPPQPYAPEQLPKQPPERMFCHTITLSFYELWSRELWDQLPGDLYGALRMQARYGNLGLSKIFKKPGSPSVMRARVYDLQNARWQADWCVDGILEIVRLGGRALPKQFTLSNVQAIGFI
jgi:hypothetical protein